MLTCPTPFSGSKQAPLSLSLHRDFKITTNGSGHMLSFRKQIKSSPLPSPLLRTLAGLRAPCLWKSTLKEGFLPNHFGEALLFFYKNMSLGDQDGGGDSDPLLVQDAWLVQ